MIIMSLLSSPTSALVGPGPGAVGQRLNAAARPRAGAAPDRFFIGRGAPGAHDWKIL